ncbi:MAG: tetratricopeptide repeat protein [Candidatus Omnitrophica bacterium]|nr:tetratricopeptide repeat protein [Candidatus Omnitrophota bacterium]
MISKNRFFRIRILFFIIFAVGLTVCLQADAKYGNVTPDEMLQQTNRIMSDVYNGIYDLRERYSALGSFNDEHFRIGHRKDRKKCFGYCAPWELATITYSDAKFSLELYFTEWAHDALTNQRISPDFGFYVDELGMYLYGYYSEPGHEELRKEIDSILHESLSAYQVKHYPQPFLAAYYYFTMGKIKQAQEMLQQVLDEFPDHAQAKELLEVIGQRQDADIFLEFRGLENIFLVNIEERSNAPEHKHIERIVNALGGKFVVDKNKKKISLQDLSDIAKEHSGSKDLAVVVLEGVDTNSIETKRSMIMIEEIFKARGFRKIVFQKDPALGEMDIKSISVSEKNIARLPGLAQPDQERKVQLIVKLEQIERSNDVAKRGEVEDIIALARIYYVEKDFDRAIIFFERALSINPFRADVVYEIAMAHSGLDQHLQAKERMQQVLELNPNPVLWSKAKMRLATMKKVDAAQVALTPLNNERDFTYKPVSVYLLPFGVEDKEMLEDLRVFLQYIYGVRFELLDNTKGPLPGYSKSRRQYFVQPLFSQLHRDYKKLLSEPLAHTLIVVTSHDITDEGINFVFGTTSAKWQMGIISFARFQSDNPDRRMLFKRLATQALSTAGFSLGLLRCSTPLCARSYPHSFAEFARKKFSLCTQCKTRRDKMLHKLSMLGDFPWSREDVERFKALKDTHKMNKL